MAVTKLGRVGLVLRGDYDPVAQYTRLDVVNYQRGAYVAKDDVKAVLPTDKEHWQKLVSLDDVAGVLTEAVADAQTAAEAAADAAEDADESGRNAASAAEALLSISFDINSDMEMEVTIPWQN